MTISPSQSAFCDALAHLICAADPAFIDTYYRPEPGFIRMHSPLVDLLETRPHDGTDKDLLVHLPTGVLNHAKSREFRTLLCCLDASLRRIAEPTARSAVQ